MKKNKKKGFTLVELLVVIAILAILATVSILGYTSFTGKAKASNAEQELAQMKTMFLADWLDGFVGNAEQQQSIIKETNDYKATLKFVVEAESQPAGDAIKDLVGKELLKALDTKDVGDLRNKVSFVYSETPTATLLEGNKYTISGTITITAVNYVSSNGYTATWNIGTDKIEAKPTQN